MTTTVRDYSVPGTSGLLVVRRNEADLIDHAMGLHGTKWDVVHLPTGFAIPHWGPDSMRGSCRRKRDALAFAADLWTLLPAIDWQTHSPERLGKKLAPRWEERQARAKGGATS